MEVLFNSHDIVSESILFISHCILRLRPVKLVVINVLVSFRILIGRFPKSLNNRKAQCNIEFVLTNEMVVK